MARSQQSFNKRQKELNRRKRKADKEQRKKDRQASGGDTSLESMMAYVDENGRLTTAPQPLVRTPSQETPAPEAAPAPAQD
jgi:hypothetical protein